VKYLITVMYLKNQSKKGEEPFLTRIATTVGPTFSATPITAYLRVMITGYDEIDD